MKQKFQRFSKEQLANSDMAIPNNAESRRVESNRNMNGNLIPS